MKGSFDVQQGHNPQVECHCPTPLAGHQCLCGSKRLMGNLIPRGDRKHPINRNSIAQRVPKEGATREPVKRHSFLEIEKSTVVTTNRVDSGAGEMAQQALAIAANTDENHRVGTDSC